MMRFGLLVGAAALFAATPVPLRSNLIPPKWRFRLGALALVGLFSAIASFLAAVLVPEVLTTHGVSQLWTTCMRAFHGLGTDPLRKFPSVIAGVALAVVLGRLTWAVVLRARDSRRAGVTEGDARWYLGGRYPVYVVPLGRVEAYSVRGQAIVSDRMLEILDEEERTAVLLHEEGHLRSRHHLVLLFGGALADCLSPLCAPRRLLLIIEQALEETADEYAAKKIGDTAVVASSVAKAALARLGSPAGALAAGGGPDVPARVRRLLQPSDAPRWMPYACFGSLALLATLLAATQALAGLALVAAAHHVFGFGAIMFCPISRRPSS